MSLLHDHPLQPPGGHSFRDHSGHTLRAKSLQELLTRIATYRLANGFPPGNPAVEVEIKYAVEFPWLVSKVGAPVQAQEDPVARWLNQIWRNPPRLFAEAETARARYETCLGCQHYVPDHPLSPDATRRLLILSAGKLGGMTGICKAHHWHCGLAAVMDKADTAQRVDGCWVK